MHSWGKILLAQKGIPERLRKLHKAETSAKLLARPSETLIALALCKPRATRYSSRAVMPNAASPASGLQKQPVRSERRARAALRSTSRSINDAPVRCEEIERDGSSAASGRARAIDLH